MERLRLKEKEVQELRSRAAAARSRYDKLVAEVGGPTALTEVGLLSPRASARGRKASADSIVSTYDQCHSTQRSWIGPDASTTPRSWTCPDNQAPVCGQSQPPASLVETVANVYAVTAVAATTSSGTSVLVSTCGDGGDSHLKGSLPGGGEGSSVASLQIENLRLRDSHGSRQHHASPKCVDQADSVSAATMAVSSPTEAIGVESSLECGQLTPHNMVASTSPCAGMAAPTAVATADTGAAANPGAFQVDMTDAAATITREAIPVAASAATAATEGAVVDDSGMHGSIGGNSGVASGGGLAEVVSLAEARDLQDATPPAPRLRSGIAWLDANDLGGVISASPVSTDYTPSPMRSPSENHIPGSAVLLRPRRPAEALAASFGLGTSSMLDMDDSASSTSRHAKSEEARSPVPRRDFDRFGSLGAASIPAGALGAPSVLLAGGSAAQTQPLSLEASTAERVLETVIDWAEIPQVSLPTTAEVLRTSLGSVSANTTCQSQGSWQSDAQAFSDRCNEISALSRLHLSASRTSSVHSLRPTTSPQNSSHGASSPTTTAAKCSSSIGSTTAAAVAAAMEVQAQTQQATGPSMGSSNQRKPQSPTATATTMAAAIAPQGASGGAGGGGA